MAGIYIHIPFCKQACHYCDFHFSTSLAKADQMIDCIKREIFLRKDELQQEVIETIYFGGGTPSILTIEQINDIIHTIYTLHKVVDNPEITLEANPDDLDQATIFKLAQSKVNRLSIGVQSFFEQDLKMMNRAHNSSQAIESLKLASEYFDNISVDLIYGIPEMDNSRWLENIQTVLDLDIPHISCYALTVEKKTALYKLIQKGQIAPVMEEVALGHFKILVDVLQKNGYEHYELSNFCKNKQYSRNNTGYWLGKKYIGIGPSAHGFDGKKRSWNISNNPLYIKSISKDLLPMEVENLEVKDRYNEYIMTGLRTMWGVDLLMVEQKFGEIYVQYLIKEASKHIDQGTIALNNGVYTITTKGKFLSDGIASDLFFLD